MSIELPTCCICKREIAMGEAIIGFSVGVVEVDRMDGKDFAADTLGDHPAQTCKRPACLAKAIADRLPGWKLKPPATQRAGADGEL
jgi:serine phosphatase RsbU (regulator of sigma subunit)